MSAPATKSLPYVLLGASQRSGLEEMLALRLTQWRERWSTSTARVSVQVSDSASEWSQMASGGSLFSAMADGVPLIQVLYAAGFMPAALNVDPASRDPGAAGGIAGQVRSEALRSLCLTLIHGMSVSMIEFDEESGTQATRLAAARAQRALPVTIAFENVGARWSIILHPSVVEFLRPKRKVNQGPIERRKNAIGPEQVRVEAILGEVEISLAELASLAHGDVLVMEKALAERVQLVTELGARVTHVALGTSDGRRAVRVVN